MEADKTLFAEERKKKIVDYINEKRRVTVPELCDAFSVSGATMRNDLRDLDESGLITRTHGGAIRKTRTGHEPVMDLRSDKNTEAKSRIAEAALLEIEDGDTIILDTGTTVKALAAILHRKKNLTVVTNDIKVAADLEAFPSCEVLVIGGLLRKGFHCTVGYGMFSNIGSLSVDKAFLGANSFSARKGASTPDLSQSEIKRQMMEIAAKVIILCDHSKLETDSFMNFASPSQVDLLVTDRIEDDLRRIYEEKDISVRTAE
ncbi:MAG: DeoR/GlpR family DNA-binding transcription regulator [Spirochaetales bacterium]|nr:DeoR/GlpR family DNA-binding transcription regulator [Spirochaetales bacterium]